METFALVCFGNGTWTGKQNFPKQRKYFVIVTLPSFIYQTEAFYGAIYVLKEHFVMQTKSISPSRLVSLHEIFFAFFFLRNVVSTANLNLFSFCLAFTAAIHFVFQIIINFLKDIERQRAREEENKRRSSIFYFAIS